MLVEFTVPASDEKTVSYNYDMEAPFDITVLDVSEPVHTTVKKGTPKAEECLKFEVTLECTQGDNGSFKCFKSFWTSTGASFFINNFKACLGMPVAEDGAIGSLDTETLIGKTGQVMMEFAKDMDGNLKKFRSIRSRGGFVPKPVEEDEVPF